jgi:hypothetical protein
MLGLAWTWIRLIILRGNAFNKDNYLREMGQFVDEADYRQHEREQGTVESIEFTLNAMKFAQ